MSASSMAGHSFNFQALILVLRGAEGNENNLEEKAVEIAKLTDVQCIARGKTLAAANFCGNFLLS